MAVQATERVIRHILTGAEAGAFAPGELLPSERTLAGLLSVSRSSVASAYEELERRGALRRIHGKGAYLCALPHKHESFSWSGKVSRFANAMDEPVLELLSRNGAEKVEYPFCAGTPALEIFPTREYQQSLEQASSMLPSILAVAPTEGRWQLREALGNWLGSPPQHVMVTGGAQEGIDLVARCLIEPNDTVIVDDPTYPGAIQSFQSAGAKLLGWKTDWSLGKLEELLLRYRPKFIFTTPTFHNPTGRVMSLKLRKELLQLAHQYATPILEDDVYRHTYFGSHPMPDSLYSLDENSLVICVSTFSKILAPGLRVGWLTAPLYIIKQLALIKMRSNLFTGGLNQTVLADMLESGNFDAHLTRMRGHHRMLSEAAMEALEPAVKQGLLRYRVPGGSLYLWCKILNSYDPERLFSLLDEVGISLAPGHAFAPQHTNGAHATFRICFTAVERARLQQGLRKLCDVLQTCNSPENRSPTASRSRSVHGEPVLRTA